jgi:hypothetical protein
MFVRPKFAVRSRLGVPSGPRLALYALSAGALFALLLTPAVNVGASTVTAASCSASAVQAAMNQASTGDTVLIPAGTCNWSSNVTWTAPANVTVQGAGTLATGGADRTVIVDDFATNSPLLRITVNSSGVFRMSRITIRSGSGGIKDQGLFFLHGSGTVALDHLHLDTISGSINNRVLDLDGVTGVLYQSILDLYSTSAIYPHNSGSTGSGDDVWAQDTAFGSSNFFFVEDSIINGTPSTHDGRVADVFWGGKIVIRFNTMTAATGYEVHATGSWGNGRGARAVELYGNLFQRGSGQSEPNRTMTDFSSGPALAWGNSANGIFKMTYLAHVTRKDNGTYSQQAVPNGWGYCGTAFNGTGSVWDQNTSATTGYACLDQPGRGRGDQLTGDHPNKINTVFGTRVWPRNALEPIYMWANGETPATGWGDAVFSDNTGGRLTQNVDYYRQASGIQTSPTSPFNGTSGTGWGTLANRPTACATGVAYWATDQGSWNTSTSNPYGVQQNAADGQLYKCTATNIWTLYYTPYTYPHPLAQTGAPLGAPTSLQLQ